MVAATVRGRELEPHSRIDDRTGPGEREIEPDEDYVKRQARPLSRTALQSEVDHEQAQHHRHPAEQCCHHQDCIEPFDTASVRQA